TLNPARVSIVTTVERSSCSSSMTRIRGIGLLRVTERAPGYTFRGSTGEVDEGASRTVDVDPRDWSSEIGGKANPLWIKSVTPSARASRSTDGLSPPVKIMTFA